MSYYWERLIDLGTNNSLIEQKIADGSDGGIIKQACQQSHNVLCAQFHIFPVFCPLKNEIEGTKRKESKLRETQRRQEERKRQKLKG